ncbi:MAG: hypothetical protein COA50_08225 [Flavobacteriaceae bacterium]|nr:MAG: hypothetical protein COA50_08225 [Flavobacteriaceae bacterium]
MKTYLKNTSIFLLLFLLIGCQHDTFKNEILSNETETKKNEAIPEENELLKETTLLLGEILKDYDLRHEVLSKMKEVDQYDEIVSLSYLLNVHQSIRKDEVKALENKQASFKKNNSKFKKALINEVVKNTDKYSALSALLKSKSPKVTNHASKSGNTDFINDFSQLLSQKKLQIYYPYEDKFLASKKQGNEFYITYAPTAVCLITYCYFNVFTKLHFFVLVLCLNLIF